MNNHEYGMIKQFQDVWFNSRYAATDFEGGLGEVDLLEVAKAYGAKTFEIRNNQEIRKKIREIKNQKSPVVCSVNLTPGEKIKPKLEFGRPIEDPWPNLSEEEMKINMVVPVLKRKRD